MLGSDYIVKLEKGSLYTAAYSVQCLVHSVSGVFSGSVLHVVRYMYCEMCSMFCS